MAQRKSIEEHELAGTYRPDRQPQQVSPIRAGRPKFPKHLGKEARAEFKRLVAQLEARGTATPGDYGACAVAAELTARWASIKAQIGEQWTVITVVGDNNGTARTVVRVNPLIPVLNATENRLITILKALGLSPTDRDKAKPVSPAKTDEPREGTVAWILQEAAKRKEANGRADA
jgi:P27 family predicted phage terminase small subunit